MNNNEALKTFSDGSVEGPKWMVLLYMPNVTEYLLPE